MPAAPSERLEMRVTPELKQRLREAAEASGKNLTRFVIDALSVAADERLRAPGAGGRRPLGWAAGTARELGDVVAPTTTPEEWDALRD